MEEWTTRQYEAAITWWICKHNPQQQAPQLSRDLNEVPEGWTPPSKEEIARSMGNGRTFAKVMAGSGKDDGLM